MITASGKYWSTGITLRWFPERPGHTEAWGGHLDYYDDGFVNDEPATGRVSTEGTLHTRYPVEARDGRNALAVVLDVLIADAQKIGIEWRSGMDDWPPMIYYQGDGEDSGYPPPSDWRELLREQARRLGWATYGYIPAANGANA